MYRWVLPYFQQQLSPYRKFKLINDQPVDIEEQADRAREYDY